MKSVAIIGAGFSGLVTAKIFKQYGFVVTVYEKESEVGGVWTSSRRYPGLTTQNPKDTYFLSDLKMPKHFPEWPNGDQVQAYLDAYVTYCHLRKHIILQTEVKKTDYDPESGKWIVKTEHTRSHLREVRVFDYLIICNGIFSDPLIPSYTGADKFIAAGGKILHTSKLNDLFEVANKNVVVVGYGKSSCDVASAIADASLSTTVVARSILWKVPKKFFGLLNMKFILLTRLGENLFEYISLSGFAKFLHTAGKPLRNFLLWSVQSVVATQLKLKKSGVHPGDSLETIARANVSLASDNFFNKILSKKIVIEKGQDIHYLLPGKAVLANGKELPASVIVCGTGYRQAIPFMNESIASKILDEQKNFKLYRNQLPIDVPCLGFNGYNSSFYSQLNAEMGALWLAEYFTGGLAIPSPEECSRHIAEKLAWSNHRSAGKNSKGTNIIPFSLHHIDELLGDIGYNVSRFTRFMQWLVPANPASYVPVIRKTIDRFDKNRRAQFFTSKKPHPHLGSPVVNFRD